MGGGALAVSMQNPPDRCLKWYISVHHNHLIPSLRCCFKKNQTTPSLLASSSDCLSRTHTLWPLRQHLPALTRARAEAPPEAELPSALVLPVPRGHLLAQSHLSDITRRTMGMNRV